uniref:Uncharacterized protein n=1 Tax=Steinernema glaseri TaxID=37863 RepID=A0A1I7YNY7_9BILA
MSVALLSCFSENRTSERRKASLAVEEVCKEEAAGSCYTIESLAVDRTRNRVHRVGTIHIEHPCNPSVFAVIDACGGYGTQFSSVIHRVELVFLITKN